MKFTDEQWAEKRSKGLARFLFFDGILITGCPFAVIMQVVGYFYLRDEGQGWGEYFSSSRTWTTFFLHATIFGLIMGSLNWWRNERSIAKTSN
jgi:hypothetical protein